MFKSLLSCFSSEVVEVIPDEALNRTDVKSVETATNENFTITDAVEIAGESVDIEGAFASGNLDFIKSLFENGTIKPTASIVPDLLCTAAQSGHLEVAKYLVAEQGVDASAANKFAVSALHLACSNGHFEVVKYLVENGANINAKCHLSLTPVHFSCTKGHFEKTKYLIEKGVDPTELDGIGQNMLHLACYSNNLQLIKYLIDLNLGLDLNLPDIDHSTPFMIACTIGSDPELIFYLLDQGAEPDIKNVYGVSPRDILMKKESN